MKSVIEVYYNGGWIPAAEFEPTGASPYAARFEYLTEYVFSADNPIPVSLAYPVTGEVSLSTDDGAAAALGPAFLLDLVPQGLGRRYLAGVLGLNPLLDENDLFFAQYGAYNPIGHLRLDTAVDFYRERVAHLMDAQLQGFRIEDLRTQDFRDYLVAHDMMAAGSTGVQGAAPKYLLTQDSDGLWFPDVALPDERAAKHWLVKLPRGNHSTDRDVLRNEAAYLRVARYCGIRSGEEPRFEDDMLFFARFDRSVDAHGVQRLHQESAASLSGLLGFGMSVSLFDLVAGVRRHVRDATGETLEFLKRDVLNVAMRNPDNHARNTAVQLLPDGTVQLTPLFDFAPMYMDREFVTRGCHWRIGKGPELERWDQIICEITDDETERRVLTQGLRDFQPTVEQLPQIMRDCGVDDNIITACERHIERQAARIGEMTGHG